MTCLSVLAQRLDVDEVEEDARGARPCTRARSRRAARAWSRVRAGASSLVEVVARLEQPELASGTRPRPSRRARVRVDDLRSRAGSTSDRARRLERGGELGEVDVVRHLDDALAPRCRRRGRSCAGSRRRRASAVAPSSTKAGSDGGRAVVRRRAPVERLGEAVVVERAASRPGARQAAMPRDELDRTRASAR